MREVLNLQSLKGRRLYDERKLEMLSRQEGKCAICHRTIHSLIDLTFDHEGGRGMGGSNRCDEILDEHGKWINAALCFGCNMVKGSKRYHWQDGKYVPKVKGE